MMIHTIVASLMYTKSRRIAEAFLPELKELWNQWEIRVLVLLSLILQVILIALGNRRKYNHKIWLNMVVWSAYLTADSVATVALSIISNELGDVNRATGSLDLNSQLKAFWAPFLLLHLGGPDTITAYSLEDNELWLRHLLGLVVQTSITFYIFTMARKNSYLSHLTLLMIVVGLAKYVERTWVLRSASIEQFRNSLLSPPHSGPNYAHFMGEYTLKQLEGYDLDVVAYEVTEVNVPETLPNADRAETLSANVNLLTEAHGLFQIFKRLFVDLILSFQDRDTSLKLIDKFEAESIFEVIEIELGFMYDLLYTKAMAVLTKWGLIRRFISFSCTCFSLVTFSLLAWKQRYDKVDLSITFLLLAVGVLLEIYAAMVLLFSDWFYVWLSNKQDKALYRAITPLLPLPKSPRWSRSMAQFSLLTFCLKEKRPLVCSKILKLLKFHEKLEKFQYQSHKKVTNELKTFIFWQIKEKREEFQEKLADHKRRSGDDSEIRVLYTHRGGDVLKKHRHGKSLIWSTEVEFDQSILIWHIATELCYYTDRDDNTIAASSSSSNYKISKHISRYMIYLLVLHPLMLPMGIGQIGFQDTCAEAIKFFEEHIQLSGTPADKKKEGSNTRKQRTLKSEACKALLNVNTEVAPFKVKGDKSKSVLFDGCRVASGLNKIPNKEEKWKMISIVWVEMLTYAANLCKANHHCQQLHSGGELLTHVWLLMAHFGITEHFRVSHGYARAKLVVK